MKEFKVDNKGTRALFDNKVLESLTRTHFAFPVTLYFFISTVAVLYAFIQVQNNWLFNLLMFITGMVIFSFVEYLIHRFLFHFKTDTEKKVHLQYNIHGIHH